MTQNDAGALPSAYASLLPLLYAGDEHYGWSAGMRAITHALLEAITLPDGPVVEVGFGGGQMLMELQQRYPTRPVMGFDLHPLALAQARDILPPTVSLCQAALPDLPWPAATLALVVALDVFDQRGVELAAALAESYRVLAADGALVLRLSAHPRLFGAHDIAFHTGQRYTRQQLDDALVAAGFVVQRLTYANTVLSPPVAAMRLAQRWGALPWQAESYEHGLLHRLAAWLLHREARWLRRANLPWGISLCAVARKP
jgi:ubiquinone/menaquinone biosynthesis C-methylase UbiE